MVLFVAGAYRWLVPAADVEAIVDVGRANAEPEGASEAGLRWLGGPAADARAEETAPRALRLRGRGRSIAVDGAIELVPVPRTALRPLPAWIAGAAMRAPLRAIACLSDGFAYELDLASLDPPDRGRDA